MTIVQASTVPSLMSSISILLVKTETGQRLVRPIVADVSRCRHAVAQVVVRLEFDRIIRFEFRIASLGRLFFAVLFQALLALKFGQHFQQRKRADAQPQIHR